MDKRTTQRLLEITPTTLVVGVDIAKSVHWMRCVDYRGIEVGKALRFNADRPGFESIVTRIMEYCNPVVSIRPKYDSVIIGMEPTGHYWKTLANYLRKAGLRVVGVNPYHTKRAKELDDNSQTKNDKKDALTIARLVKDGRFFDPYLPLDIFAELRVLTNSRICSVKRQSAVKNIITAVLDEYFPEISTVFRNPMDGKASRQILRGCPFPSLILAMSEDEILAEVRKAVRKSVGIKRVRKLIEAAKVSVGVDYGLESAKHRLGLLLEELELHEKQLAATESAMETLLKSTGYDKIILGIKGIGVVTAASFFGELGDPMRFENARQIARYAGYSLVEDSSGKSKSGTVISKRGRGPLRSLLYQIAFRMVGQNPEMKALYRYLTSRPTNPLKKKQALVVISKKIITVIYALLKNHAAYDPALVLGAARREMMAA